MEKKRVPKESVPIRTHVIHTHAEQPAEDGR
jgi:hypothetical protein